MSKPPAATAAKDSFITTLAKFAAFIFVGWNTLWLCAMLPVIALVILGAVFASVPTPAMKLGTLENVWGDAASANQLLVIPITGVIVGEYDGAELGGFSGAINGYEIKQKLREAADRPEVMGIMLEINSFGGTIYGSQAIADGIKYYRERTKQPVYAHIQGFGASGAYWAAAATDKIIADYGSDVGSIGVMMGPFKYYDTVLSEGGGLFDGSVMTQNGIESLTITAGKSKDIGSPYRRITAEEQRQLQSSINNEYERFVSFVSERRNIPAATVKSQVGAMIYDNQTAQSLKLIDASGSREEAYVKLAKAAKLDDYQVMREVMPAGFLGSLLMAIGHAPKPAATTPFDTCSLTRVKLAYHGNAASLCQ